MPFQCLSCFSWYLHPHFHITCLHYSWFSSASDIFSRCSNMKMRYLLLPHTFCTFFTFIMSAAKNNRSRQHYLQLRTLVHYFFLCFFFWNYTFLSTVYPVSINTPESNSYMSLSFLLRPVKLTKCSILPGFIKSFLPYHFPFLELLIVFFTIIRFSVFHLSQQSTF